MPAADNPVGKVDQAENHAGGEVGVSHLYGSVVVGHLRTVSPVACRAVSSRRGYRSWRRR